MASVDKLTVLPRPRTAWQAMDAGFTLARPHWPKLVFMWMVLATPFFLIPQLLLPDNPYIALLIAWWFKPLYEVPILIYLSGALFGEYLSIRVALRRSFRHIKRLLFSYLSISRLSTHRSLTMPVVILEQLPYSQTRQRISVLTAAVTRAFSLQTVCLHVEYLLTYALLALVLFFIPWADSFNVLDFMEEIFDDEFLPRWYWTLSAGTVFIAASAVAPFFVGAGFMLYINRRMKIEAWDIEHQFRRLVRERTAAASNTFRTQNSQASLLCILLFGVFFSLPTEAQNNPPEPTQIDINPTSLSLNSDTLPTVADTKALIEDIKSAEEFGFYKDKKVLKFKKRPKKSNESLDDELPDWAKWLSWLPNAFQGFANLVQWLLWILAAFLLVVAFLAIRRFLPESVRTTLTSRSRIKERVDFVAHPLTSNLPDDIPGAAQAALKKGNKREALSLLYRGAIRALIKQHQLPVPKGATESECLKLVQAKAAETQKTAFTSLVSHWQQTAYANRDFDDNSITSLIQNWPAAFHRKSTNQTVAD